MPWFIKTEQFTSQALKLSSKQKSTCISKHQEWVIKLKGLGLKISSGYLVDERRIPGGGGLLILEANSFQEAKKIIENDPIIISGLVTWKLQEWIPVSGNLLN